jgi:predicted  nucleic acid-binding Zn-ribbon protein
LKADPAAQLRLLDLQSLDSRADQLRHQRDTLPEIAEIEELTTHQRDLETQRIDQQMIVDDLEVERAKVDSDVEAVRARQTRDQQRIDQGLIANPKDLQHMQAELESLQRRITSLEDQELEVMEQLEEAQNTLTQLAEQAEAAQVRLTDVTAARTHKAGAIDTELAAVETERASLVAELPADLLALYDRLRAAKGGVAAAELRARECGGCRLAVDAAELGVIRAAAEDEVVRCEECQRILVRTSESGL